MRTRMSSGSHRGRPTRARADSLGLARTALAPYQLRICVRCGHSTTFVLEDAVGGWYSCIECGHYA
jgi:PHP family Zn ribbon phosphoesterase